MGEIGAGTGTSYPATLDVDSNLEYDSPAANKTVSRAAPINDLAAAVIAIETALGTTPQGSIADVKTYLQTEHTAAGAHKNFAGLPVIGATVGGTADAITLTPTVPLTAYLTNQVIIFKATGTNTGATTVNVSGLGVKSIKKNISTDLSASDIVAGAEVVAIYDGTQFQFVNLPISLTTPFYSATVGGTGDAITLTPVPSVAAYTTGMKILFIAAAANTGATTVAVSGLAAKSIKKVGSVALDANDILSGRLYEIVYDGTNFQLSAIAPANTTAPIYVGVTATSATALTATPAIALTAYTVGQVYTALAHAPSGAGATIAISGLAAKTIYKYVDAAGSKKVAIVAGDWMQNQMLIMVYDGTDMQLVAPSRPMFALGTNNISAGGAIAITGVGFRPRMVLISATKDGAAPGVGQYIGYSDGNTQYSIYETNGAADTISPINSFYVSDTTNSLIGTVTSMDADGFTLTLTLNGTITAKYMFLAIR